MRAWQDITGRRFGRLVALSYTPGKGGSYGQWICRCDCGTEKSFRACNILNGRTVSCGCVHKAKHRRFGEATMNACYANHRSRGRVKGLGYLEKDVWVTIVTKPCHYCGGVDLKNNASKRKSARYKIPENELHLWAIRINGVDRINSSRGYVADNCVPCCKTCNLMKNKLSVQEFEEHIRRLSEHLRSKQAG